MTLQTELSTAWTKVLAVVQKVANGIDVAIEDAQAALAQIANNVPTIVTELEELAGFVEGTPAIASNSEVQALVADANKAVAGLNAFAKSYNTATTGGSVTVSQAVDAVVSGAQAALTAKTATAAATSAAIGASQAPAAAAPASGASS